MTDTFNQDRRIINVPSHQSRLPQPAMQVFDSGAASRTLVPNQQSFGANPAQNRSVDRYPTERLNERTTAQQQPLHKMQTLNPISKTNAH